MSAREKQTAERDDAQIIRSIRDGYGAPDLTPARRTAIDARVWERVERRRRFGVVTGMAVGAALAAGLMLIARADRIAVEPGVEPATVASAPALGNASDSAWADALLYDSPDDTDSQDRLDELPDEYRAITDVLLEG